LSDYRSGNWTARFVPFQLLLLALVVGVLLVDAGITFSMWRRCKILKEPLSLKTQNIAASLELKPLVMGALALLAAGMSRDLAAIVRWIDLMLCAVAYAGVGVTRKSLNQPVVVDYLYAQVKCENGD
jgi:hypothetical protein